MLTFEQKIELIEKNFPMLVKNIVSLNRVNYKYPDSAVDKENIIYHLHPNGNGFVYTDQISGMAKQKNGYTNIRDYSAEELLTLITKALDSVKPKEAPEPEIYQERWINEDGQILLLVEEGEQFNVYAGEQLDGTFNSYGEAAEFLDEEGFSFESEQ